MYTKTYQHFNTWWFDEDVFCIKIDVLYAFYSFYFNIQNTDSTFLDNISDSLFTVRRKTEKKKLHEFIT